MTTEEARKLRTQAEQQILAVLTGLQAITGLDIADIKLMKLVDTVNDEPVRRVVAVRIELAV